MIGAELLEQIDQRLKQITGKFTKTSGDLAVILIGNLHQLPTITATTIFELITNRITGLTLW